MDQAISGTINAISEWALATYVRLSLPLADSDD